MTNARSGHGRAQMDDAQRAIMRAAARRIDRVNEWLMVGGAVSPNEFERLTEAGISRVVDLREDHEGANTGVERLETLGVSRRQVPVPNGSPPALEQLVEVVEWLKVEDAEGHTYVHCGGGFGRAVAMAAGLLIHQGLGADEAVQCIREVRPEIRLNEAQFAWLSSVEAMCQSQP